MSPVAPGLMRVTGPTSFPSTGEFIAFRWRSGPRTITPYLYSADGTPDGGALSALTIASTPAFGTPKIAYIKRTGSKAYVLAHVSRVGSADDTMGIYDIDGDTWTAELTGRPPAVDDIGNWFATETGDEYFYHYGSVSSTFYLRRFSVDGVTTDEVVASTGTSGARQYQIAEDTLGEFSSSSGREITTGGTVTDPTAYDESGTVATPWVAFPASTFIGERLIFRTAGMLPYRVDISGADLTQVSRSSGWGPPAINGTVALNDNNTAFGIYYFDQTTSPPSRSFDWVDALPKTAQHGSSVEIRPVDYVSPGSPGTLAELPDAVFALGAGP